ncbi:MAG: glycoside hydrolase family 65 protein [Lachnospiraceae bacterium]|nr:glycoside hydrolase family 65 protein [Lachnospiraceae bacterium]
MIAGGEPIYPVEEWTVTETIFDKSTNYRNETTFSLSNGYIGTRGTFEEAYNFDIDTGLEGNFVNGFYESEKIRYGEANFGSPLYSQSLLNLPNLKETKLFVDGEEFSMEKGTVAEYARVLDMKEGILRRGLVWTSPGGKSVQICTERLVSFEMEHIIATRYEVEPLNFSGEIRFVSKLQGNVENHTRKTNPIVDYGPFGRKLEAEKLGQEETLLYYEGTTQTSKLTVGCGSSHKVMVDGIPIAAYMDAPAVRETKRKCTIQGDVSELEAFISFEIAAQKRVPVSLEKMICYATSLEIKKEELECFVKEELKRAETIGYERLRRYQKNYLEKFWETADIRIKGEESDALIQGLHFNLFHIFQSAVRGGKHGMGAKGLSGEGYEGHYFWDTEMYVLPVFIYTAPETARRLMDFRYETLDQARERARILGHDKGALFPWRTINGEEASTYYPLGTAQYHINADIAYALSLYLQVTGDKEYLKNKGIELLIETARIWADVGSFAECKDGRYCICCVTGPDEYNVLVDNNFYTNLMAREHLKDAAGAVRWMMKEEPAAYRALKERLDFKDEELIRWDEITGKMYFPYDGERKIYPMDDGFMMRKPWDEEKIPEEKRAWLYENYHPLFIMRHRMSKQADAILGMYLHSNLFTEEEIRRNYDFYQEVTLHHSSLSTCIFGIVACDIGRVEEAYKYFMESARMDLDDHHNNFYAGIHAANMAGTWQMTVNGFGGMRCQGGRLTFKPGLPEKWESYAFKVQYQECVLEVSVEKESVRFSLLGGHSICFYVNGEKIELNEGKREWSGNR